MSWALEFIFMSATHSFVPDRSLRRDCNQLTKPRPQEIFMSTKEALVWSPVGCLRSTLPLYACATLHPAGAYLCLLPLLIVFCAQPHWAHWVHWCSLPVIDRPVAFKMAEPECGLSPPSFMLSLGRSSNSSDNLSYNLFLNIYLSNNVPGN